MGIGDHYGRRFRLRRAVSPDGMSDLIDDEPLGATDYISFYDRAVKSDYEFKVRMGWAICLGLENPSVR